MARVVSLMRTTKYLKQRPAVTKCMTIILVLKNSMDCTEDRNFLWKIDDQADSADFVWDDSKIDATYLYGGSSAYPANTDLPGTRKTITC